MILYKSYVNKLFTSQLIKQLATIKHSLPIIIKIIIKMISYKHEHSNEIQIIGIPMVEVELVFCNNHPSDGLLSLKKLINIHLLYFLLPLYFLFALILYFVFYILSQNDFCIHIYYNFLYILDTH